MPLPEGCRIRLAGVDDAPTILALIRGLADYERLLHEVVATEDDLRRTLFGPRPSAEVLIAEQRDAAVGFALFFASYSTFLGRPGIYLEDLFVVPEARGRGLGKALMIELARLAVERGCGRFEWAVLDWNVDAIGFYRALGAIGMDSWRVQRVTGDALVRLAAEEP